MAISRLDMERQLRNMGGIMSLQEPRQGYFLGKLVKKAKKVAKKVFKSPLGKAALLGGLGYLGAAKLGGLGGLKGALLGKGAMTDFGTGSAGLLKKLGLIKSGYGSFGGLTGLGKVAGIGGLSGLAGLLAAGEQEEDDEIDFGDRGEGLDIDRIVRLARMNDPQFRFLPSEEFTNVYADGGRAEYRVGGASGREYDQKYDADKKATDTPMISGGGGDKRSTVNLNKTTPIKADPRFDFGRNIGKGLPPKELARLFSEFYGLPTIDDNDESQGMQTAVTSGFEPQNVQIDPTGMISTVFQPQIASDINKVKTGSLGLITDDLLRDLNMKAEGGIMNLGGMEMDLRGGGFVPLGAKERADDVPARLSKNEFVMTADAVRAAGGGSVDKGADKMYKLMKGLEAQV